MSLSETFLFYSILFPAVIIIVGGGGEEGGETAQFRVRRKGEMAGCGEQKGVGCCRAGYFCRNGGEGWRKEKGRLLRGWRKKGIGRKEESSRDDLAGLRVLLRREGGGDRITQKSSFKKLRKKEKTALVEDIFHAHPCSAVQGTPQCKNNFV